MTYDKTKHVKHKIEKMFGGICDLPEIPESVELAEVLTAPAATAILVWTAAGNIQKQTLKL